MDDRFSGGQGKPGVVRINKMTVDRSAESRVPEPGRVTGSHTSGNMRVDIIPLAIGRVDWTWSS